MGTNNLDIPARSEPSEYKCEYPAVSAAFSPKGDLVIAITKPTIHIFNTKSTDLLHELALPNGEEFSWVGFSPSGNDIISVSIFEKEHSQLVTKDTNQQTSQEPNIIRVWRAGTKDDQKKFPSNTGYWSLERDGRVLSPEGFVTWVPPDTLAYLGRDVRSRTYYNPFVLSPKGVVDIEYNDICIGNRWAECYTHKG